MATLHVEDFPDDLYEALRNQAEALNSSLAEEVIQALKNCVAVPVDLERRREFYDRALEMSRRPPLTPGPHPSSEELIREHRES